MDQAKLILSSARQLRESHDVYTKQNVYINENLTKAAARVRRLRTTLSVTVGEGKMQVDSWPVVTQQVLNNSSRLTHTTTKW